MPEKKKKPVSVFFAHGRESGPWGVKILALAKVAQDRNCNVESVNYTDLPDADLRVKRLLNLTADRSGRIVLVGSSMGGYVSTVASKTIAPAGLFLMAPILYMDAFANRDPAPRADNTIVVHGWNDEVAPVDQTIRFAMKHKVNLHLVPGDHSLIGQVEFLECLFGFFLSELA